MNYLDLTIEEIHKALLEGKTNPLELTKEAIKRAKENKDNAFEMFIEEDALKKAEELSKLPVPEDNYFFGIPYVAKDNYSTKGYETTASSNILNGYVPLFDATVIKLLNDAGAILLVNQLLMNLQWVELVLAVIKELLTTLGINHTLELLVDQVLEVLLR